MLGIYMETEQGFFGGGEGESNKHIKQTKVINVTGNAMINSIP